ncbi:BAH domain-containing protein [Heracleum sosnowskyi]|uniref:BAH domain-containing protein n=1 Tax=Heracleum sosnowskyi TaxID=360622 RepID=A0AAD8HY76_9APIA|nr:BAH domain-containing protein [Heracleum sosnowskyi]
MEAPAYVKWKEAFVLSERGTKQVRYYLKRKDGSLDLAVVGTKKRSLVPLPYCYNVCNKDLLKKCSFVFNLKSRTQVVQWLNSFISGSPSLHLQPPQSGSGLLEVNNDCQLSSETIKDGRMWKLGKHTTESLWLGSPSTCKKKRKHYQSFQHGGVRFSIHDFVYVLAEEITPRVAYLTDMYEDSRGKKMVVVRWFRRIDEVCIALPETYNDWEIFFSLCFQDLKIECIDGLASVLSPQHYQIFFREARHTQFKPFVCHKQIDNDDVKPLDITRVKGYREQKIFEYMFTSSASNNVKNHYPLKNGLEVDLECGNALNIKPKKRLRICYKSAKFLQPVNDSQAPHADLTVLKLTDSSINYKGERQMYPLSESMYAVSLATKDVPMKKLQGLTLGAQVEVLSQDSGVRGCWFRALIIKKNKDKVKVRYLDIKDAADEARNLEEWILSSRVALPDEWGLRINGRTTVRPAPVFNKSCDALVVKDGSAVDVWWHDGWWEGIIIQKESGDNFLVYFPGEKRDSVFSQNNFRPSQEWLGIGWKQINDRPDLVTSVLSDLCRKLDTVKSCEGGSPPCKSVACDDKVQFGFDQEDTLLNSYKVKDKFVVGDIVKDDLLANLKWKSSRKRKHSRISSEKLYQSGTKNKSSTRAFGTRTWEKFFVSSLIKVDQENRKYTRQSAFSSSIASSLSNMVLSQ